MISEKSFHKIVGMFLIILAGLLFSSGTVVAENFIFQNDTEDDLVIIHGDTGNLTVAGDISARDGFFSNLGSLVSRITSLFVQDVNVSGDINVTGDIRVGGDIDVTGNASASWFKGIFNWIVGTASQVYLSFNGTQLDFDESQLNQTIDTRISGSESGLHVNISDYWNTGDRGELRNISQIQGSWLTNDLSWINFTDGDTRYILITDESDLNVNRSEWWSTVEGDLNDVSDILGSWLTNNLAWINFSQGDTQYLLITDEANLNVNASDYWITDEGVKKNVVDILGSEITNDLGWINQTQGDALYVPIGRTLTAGAGLTGGGNLSEDRSFAVGQGTGIIVNSDDVAVNTTYLSDNYIDEAQSAGGDLGDTYPNPSVFKINGTSLGTTTATSGNILIGSGTVWETRAISGDINISSTGLTTIQPDSVVLGTDTTGNYVGDVASGSGISVSGTPGEGYTETVALNYGTDFLGWTNLTDYPDECPAGQAVRVIGDTLTCINISSQGSETLDGYDSTFFMPLNTSVVGNFSFNGGWTEGGLSIIEGDIYAQQLFVYNISHINVSHLSINGSLLPWEGFDNQFDIGASDRKWRDLYIGRDASIGGDLSLTGTMTSGTVPWIRLSDHPTIEAGTGLEGGGDLSTNRTLSLTDTGVSAGGYGSTTINYPRFTVDAKGRITSATNQTIRTATISVSGITTLTASTASTSNTTAATPWGVKVAYDIATAKASPGTCPSGQVVQNTTTGGVQCVDVDKASAVNGTGTANTIAKFTGTTTIGDSGINDLSNALAITIDSSERVGIGTTSPYTKLQVGIPYSDTSMDANAISVFHPTPVSNTALNDPKNVLYLGRMGTSAESWGTGASFSISRWEDDGVDSRARLDINLAHGSWTSESALVNVMTMLSSGNVGIGTTTPQQRLHINGSAIINGTLNMDSNKIISLGNGTSAQDAVTLSQLQSVNESAVAEETDPYWTGNQSLVYLKSNPFSFVNTTTASDLNYLILSKWANITDAPTTLSFFTDDLGDRGYTHLTNFTDDILWTTGFNATGDSRWLGVGGESDPLWTGNWTNVAFINKANAFGAFNQSFDTNVLFVDATNNRVGIGTTVPTHELNVVGDANITGNLQVLGTVNATMFYGDGLKDYTKYTNGNVITLVYDI